MKPSVLLGLPLFAISTCTFTVSASPTNISHDITAIAGSIADIDTVNVTNSTKSALELEYETLETLKQQLFHLHNEVIKKERDILLILREDFRSCSGVKCYLQTALRKAPDFFELFKTHFRHSTHNVSGRFVCPSSADPTWMSSDFENSQAPEETHKYNDGKSDSPFDFNSPDDGNAPFIFNDDQSDNPFGFNTVSDEAPSFHFNERPPPDGPFDFNTPSTTVTPPSDFDLGSDKPVFDFNEPGDVSSAVEPNYHNKPYHERPPFHMPHPAPRPRYYTLTFAISGLFVSLLIIAALFKGLRIYCANPRVRADRAARIEECRTKREYRRAACQHRLRQCVSKFRFLRWLRKQDADDYEEKEAMLQVRNRNTNTSTTTSPIAHLENHVVGANINSLRAAHSLVGQLILAEEGRSQTFPYARPQTRPEGEVYLPGSSYTRSIRSTTTTLPPYTHPYSPIERTSSLPRYSQELSREIIEAVDGFRYTPTPSAATPSLSASSFIIDDGEDNVTEGTSVVDCQSRVSMETTTIGRRSVSLSLTRGRKASLELVGDRYIGRYD